VNTFYRATACKMQRMVGPIAGRKPSFRPPIRLSVCQASGSWQNERSLWPHSYTAWKDVRLS